MYAHLYDGKSWSCKYIRIFISFCYGIFIYLYILLKLNNGVFQPEITIEIAKMMADENEDLINLAKEVIEECQTVTNPDKYIYI